MCGEHSAVFSLVILERLWSCYYFRQKTAYEMRISDWSSDVCSSDLMAGGGVRKAGRRREAAIPASRDRPVERRRIAGRIGLRNRIEVELGHGSRFLCSSFVSHQDGAMQSLDLTRREGVREAA